MKFLLIVCMYSMSFTVLANTDNEKNSKQLKGKDNDEYIASYNSKLIVKPFLQQQLMSLELIDKSNDSPHVIYYPNGKIFAGFDLNYRFLGLSLLFIIPKLQADQARLGETKVVNFKLGINTTHISLESIYQKYSGFYLHNIYQLKDNFNLLQDTFPQKKNLSISTFGLNMFFQGSGKMSLAAAFNQTKRQLKSAGAFLFMLSYQFSGISNNDTLVPVSSQKELKNITNYRSGKYHTFTFAPGYGYTYVFLKSFFVTLIGYAGVGFQPQNNTYADKTEFKLKSCYKLNFKSSVGYNTDVFFAGLSAGLDVNSINLENIKLRIMPMFWKFGVGVRF